MSSFKNYYIVKSKTNTTAILDFASLKKVEDAPLFEGEGKTHLIHEERVFNTLEEALNYAIKNYKTYTYSKKLEKTLKTLEITKNEKDFVIAKNQKELDSFIKNVNSKILIDFGGLFRPAIIKGNIKNEIEAINHSVVKVYGENKITAIQGAIVDLYDKSMCLALDNSIITGHDNSYIESYNETTIYGYNNCLVRRFDNSKVSCCNNSICQDLEKQEDLEEEDEDEL